MRPRSRRSPGLVAGVVLALALPLCAALGSSAPARASATVTFGAAGDHQATANARAVLRGVGAAHPDFFMSLGDLSYDQLSADAWCQMVKDELNAGAGLPAGSAYGETFPFAITQGNHELSTIDNFLTPTCLPDRLDTATAPGSSYGHDYVLDYPADAPTVRIISTSPSLAPLSYRAGGAGLQWLSDMIDAGRAAGLPWIVVTNHLNYISSASNSNEVGSPFFNLLVAKKVDLVLQGHDHNYQRSKQFAHSAGCPEVPTGVVDPDCIVDDGSDGIYQAGAGPVLVISGAGGAPLYAVNPMDTEAGYFATARGSESGSVFGWSKVTATDTTLQLAYQSTGTTALQDSFTITKGPPPPPDTAAPSPPAGVTATAIASRVDLSWSPAVDDRGVTGYEVWRDGVQLTTVANTSYSDNGAQPGRSYSYTVRALDAAGNVSTDSTPATVTTPQVSSVIFSETWPGADGSTWPAAWTTSAAAGGLADTRGGAGSLSVAATSSGSYARALLSAGDPVADSELLTRFAWSSTAATSYASVYLRGSGGWQNSYRPLTGYGLEVASNSTTVTVRRVVAGAIINLAAPAAFVRTTAPQWIRFRVEGSSLRFRTWVDGTSEPSTWTWSGTDTAITTPGRLHLSLNRSSSSTVAQTASFDDLTLSSTAAPPPPGDTTAPSAPGAVTATAVADEREVEIDWQPSTDDVGVVGYEVLRDGVLLPGTVTGPPWLDPTVAAGSTYIYAVRAFDGAGNRSAASSGPPVTVPVPPDSTPPSTPASLIATAAPDHVALSWPAATDDTAVTGYDVLRDGTPLTTVSSTTWTDTSVTAGSTYTYGVRARDAAGNTSELATTPAVTVPFPGDTTAPSAPAAVNAVVGSSTDVTVSWAESTDDTAVTGYDVLRDGTVLTTVSGTSWTDTTASAGSTYTYAVRARDAAGNTSAAMAAAAVTLPMPVDTDPPSVPGSVTATPVSGTSALVSWSASSDDGGVVGYDVLRDGVLRTTTTATSWTDAGLTPATAYTYTVRARDGAGNVSAPSDGAPVTTPDTLAPTVPLGVAAAATSGTSAIVSWSASTDNVAVTGYDVLLDGIVRTTTSATSWTDTGLTPATAYTYSVRARDAAGNTSPVSASAPVTTPDTLAPTAPTSVTAAATSSTTASVSWSASSDNVAVTGYEVLRDGVLRATTTATSWTDTGLSPSTTYSYTVRARDAAANTSPPSAAATATTPAASAELFRDTWTLTDQSPWGSSWTTGRGVNGSITTVSGTGQVGVPPTSRNRVSYGRAQLTGIAARTGSDVTFSFRWGAATAGATLNVYLRGSGGWQSANRPRNGYGIELSATSSTVALRRTVSGSTTTLASTTGAQQVGTMQQSIRIQVTGSIIRYRTWMTGQAEPSTWRASVSDTSVTAAGQLFVSLVSASGGSGTRTLQLDDLVVSSLP
jgi:chitodextrinase